VNDSVATEDVRLDGFGAFAHYYAMDLAGATHNKGDTHWPQENLLQPKPELSM
jgi:hypothetical protein